MLSALSVVTISTRSLLCSHHRTHYFYRLLGASYTFPAHNLNQASGAQLCN